MERYQREVEMLGHDKDDMRDTDDLIDIKDPAFAMYQELLDIVRNEEENN